MIRSWVCVGTLLGLFVHASAQTATVIERRRVGSNVEDVTLVDKGPLSKYLVMLDGDELRRVKLTGQPKPPELLCDLSAMGVVTDWTPRGIAWVSKTKEFVVHDLWTPFHPVTELIFFDDKCQHVRRVPAIYPPGLLIGNTEGMDYVPKSSPQWREHIAMIVDDENFRPVIAIFDLDGVIVHTIRPDEPVASTYGLGLSYVEPGGFRVTLLGANESWIVNFDGTVGAGPLPDPHAIGSEGLDQDDDGTLLAMNYRAQLVRTSTSLEVLPGSERSLVYGPNIPRALGVAHQDGRFVFRAGIYGNQLNATEDSFAHNLFLTTLTSGAAPVPATIGGTRTVLVSFPQDRSFQLYDDLTQTLEAPVDVSAAFPDALSGPPAFADSTSEVFLLERGELGRPAVAQVVGLDGVSLRELDLGATLGVAAVDSISWRPSSAPLGELVVLADGRIWISDLDGGLIASFDLPSSVALTNVAAVNDGIYAGLVAGMEALDTNRLYLLDL